MNPEVPAKDQNPIENQISMQVSASSHPAELRITFSEEHATSPTACDADMKPPSEPKRENHLYSKDTPSGAVEKAPIVEIASELSEDSRIVLDHMARLVFDLNASSEDPLDYLVSYQAEYQDYLDDGSFIDVSKLCANFSAGISRLKTTTTETASSTKGSLAAEDIRQREGS